MTEGKIIQGIDILDLLRFVGKKNKAYQAMLLNDLEGILDKDSDEYKKCRKLILDGFNNYTRSILTIIFGDTFEGIF